MRILFPAMVCIFLVLVMKGSVLACDCVTPSPEECFKNADVIFEGALVRAGRAADGPFVYTFRVNKLLKGPRAKEIDIVGMFTNCDATFYSDIIYRVYAHEFQGKLRSGICDGNQVLALKQQVSYPGVQSHSVWQFWYVKAVAMLALLFVVIVLLRATTRTGDGRRD